MSQPFFFMTLPSHSADYQQPIDSTVSTLSSNSTDKQQPIDSTVGKIHKQALYAVMSAATKRNKDRSQHH
jgi:hypothetical protein